MAFSLSPRALGQGYRLEAHESVGSTNALALEHAMSGDAGKLWVVAKKQESGRGRRGRPWETPSGNLAATVLMAGGFEPRHAATLGFVAGLSLSDALQAALPDQRIDMALDGANHDKNRFTLKWPNDVLADGAKLSGILLESTMLKSDKMAVVIGIGVNVIAHPADTPYPATSLAAMGSDFDAEALFLALSDAWVDNMALWRGGDGLSSIRDKWLSRAAGLGGEVAVKTGETITRGIFETIDEECRFIIRTDDGTRVPIAAGDVHFGAVASAGAI
ncbi:biotin--[acetyl-CoA-carboxylase] ligase [Limoniibacter endophyticus]|uniref:biotin--[biotin carboxyl-carrier protein] ligase n=1 Tax=Limoniibacter endophyticus TaxID=1565040 RepID=A0A8J3DND4_9HYPH|nr:biotin--[acetyl-CoA-carboxylase] ligase [Limoniibacter endophyticus]GHC60432.1 biotin--[acetyl-CoA-carboxylase] ligase [Limoniibacter endophyticus]